VTASAPAAEPLDLQAPPLPRRLASFLYEGVLLFGVTFVVGLVYGVAEGQRHALHGRQGLAATLFIAYGLYFVTCWSRSGRTLPMQTWHIRLVTRDGAPVPPWRAAARYLVAWIWFLPPLAAVAAFGLKSSVELWVALAAWVLAYAVSSRWLPQRQFAHDLLCGTRLQTYCPAPKKPQ
jgi:uncharacterized RDD family membrane protein YckC